MDTPYKSTGLVVTVMLQWINPAPRLQVPDIFALPINQESAEFWRRWHISLSSWLRDYLYISLGGNHEEMYERQLITDDDSWGAMAWRRMELHYLGHTSGGAALHRYFHERGAQAAGINRSKMNSGGVLSP